MSDEVAEHQASHVTLRRAFLARLQVLPPDVRDKARSMAHFLHQQLGLSWGRSASMAASRAEMYVRHLQETERSLN
jgi:hypothetical protein